MMMAIGSWLHLRDMLTSEAEGQRPGPADEENAHYGPGTGIWCIRDVG